MAQPRKALDTELNSVRDDILRLGSLVYRSTERAVEAFSKQDVELAQHIINQDDELDELHHKVERTVTMTVALQQPMAADLRKLMAALLIANELERMGDHAEGIAKTVIRYDGGRFDIPPLLLQMLETIREMVQKSMDAFLSEDADLAEKTAELDDGVDMKYQQLFKDIVGAMGVGELPVEEGTYILWAGHGLERIGDRVTNICERIKYIETGEVEDFNEKLEERV